MDPMKCSLSTMVLFSEVLGFKPMAVWLASLGSLKMVFGYSSRSRILEPSTCRFKYRINKKDFLPNIPNSLNFAHARYRIGMNSHFTC